MSNNHTPLSEIAFSTAIQYTPTFKKFEPFKQGICIRRQNIMKLYDKYQQACRYGCEYLRQNPNIYANDVKLIEDVINGN